MAFERGRACKYSAHAFLPMLFGVCAGIFFEGVEIRLFNFVFLRYFQTQHTHAVLVTFLLIIGGGGVDQSCRFLLGLQEVVVWYCTYRCLFQTTVASLVYLLLYRTPNSALRKSFLSCASPSPPRPTDSKTYLKNKPMICPQPVERSNMFILETTLQGRCVGRGYPGYPQSYFSSLEPNPQICSHSFSLLPQG